MLLVLAGLALSALCGARALQAETLALAAPPLAAVRAALAAGLRRNYAAVAVDVGAPPAELGERFASAHLGAACALVDAGGVAGLLRAAERNRSFAFDELADAVGVAGAVSGVLAASAADRRTTRGCNGELAASCTGAAGGWDCVSRAGIVAPCSATRSPASVPAELRVAKARAGPLANVALLLGPAADVVRVRVSQRSGDQDFGTAVQEALAPLGDVGLGGVVFLRGEALTNFHIMPDFPPGDMTFPQLVQWLTFWNTTTNVDCAARILSNKALAKNGMAPSHIHCFNDTADFTAHYHHDYEPAKVEIEAYFQRCTTLTYATV